MGVDEAIQGGIVQWKKVAQDRMNIFNYYQS